MPNFLIRSDRAAPTYPHGSVQFRLRRDQARVRSLLELQFKYPAEYVAYIDRWRTKGKIRQLLPQVFAHSASLADVQNAVSELPPQDRPKAVIHYTIDPHQKELPVHYDLPNR